MTDCHDDVDSDLPEDPFVDCEEEEASSIWQVADLPAVPKLEDDSWRDNLLYNKNYVPKSTLSNAYSYLKNIPECRARLAWDVRRLQPVLTHGAWWKDGDSERRPLADQDVVEIAEWLASTERIALDEGQLNPAIQAVAKQVQIDEVAEYLEDLEWDGQPRLDNMMTLYLGVDVSPYVVAVSAAWAISAVARALKPGCKVDHMIVLSGPQGARKSTAIAILGGKFYAELAIDVSNKDSLMAIHGPWIIEWSEMAGLGKRETESVKSFLTRPEDRFRAPYARHVQDYPRRCVFAGTTNDSMLFTDLTGNRRFWPVTVGEVRVDELQEARDQLWAEATFRFKSGEPWWLPAEVEHLARIQQEERVAVDPWEQTLLGKLAPDAIRGGQFFVSVDELLFDLDLPSSSRHAGVTRRLSQIMPLLGWRSHREPGGLRRRGYVRMDDGGDR